MPSDANLLLLRGQQKAASLLSIRDRNHRQVNNLQSIEYLGFWPAAEIAVSEKMGRITKQKNTKRENEIWVFGASEKK